MRSHFRLGPATGSILAAWLGPNHELPHPLLQRSVSDATTPPCATTTSAPFRAIGAFLASSRGYELLDEITGYLAGLFAFCVAFFPSFNPRGVHYTRLDVEFGYAHTTFAALLFLMLAYICIFLFRKLLAREAGLLRGQNWSRYSAPKESGCSY